MTLRQCDISISNTYRCGEPQSEIRLRISLRILVDYNIFLEDDVSDWRRSEFYPCSHDFIDLLCCCSSRRIAACGTGILLVH